MSVFAWLISRPKIAGLLLLTLFAVGWHFQDKISDWWDDRKIKNLEAQVTALQGDVATLQEETRQQAATIQAADEARKRNDEAIARIRLDTQGRASRAPTATPAERVQDVQSAINDYQAAADRVRGTRAE